MYSESYRASIMIDFKWSTQITSNMEQCGAQNFVYTLQDFIKFFDILEKCDFSFVK